MHIRDEIILKKFGERLRELRLAKKLTQEALELNAGISKNQVGNIERGEVNPTVTTITAIANALGIQAKDLLDF